MSAVTIALRGVERRASPRFRLHIDDLVIGPGVTVVAGPNGSGKSTLLRLVATVDHPHEGTLHISGRTPLRSDELVTIRRSVGYAPQDDSVPPRRSVFDHVDLVAVMREIEPRSPERRRALVLRALRDLDLVPVASQRAGDLSGGTRRRAALAAAWCGAPALLVLDEPTTHLDEPHALELATLIAGRPPGGATVLATHDLGWARSIADRVVHLDAGCVTGVEAVRRGER